MMMQMIKLKNVALQCGDCQHVGRSGHNLRLAHAFEQLPPGLAKADGCAIRVSRR